MHRWARQHAVGLLCVAFAAGFATVAFVKESDLYEPIKRLLEGQDYAVKGEIGACDIVAVRGEEPPVIVELKLVLNLDLVMQASERLRLSDHVYIAVPRKATALRKRGKSVARLLRRLGLGLLVIDMDAPVAKVDVRFDPGPYQPRKSAPHVARLLREFRDRVGDPTPGGSSTRAGRMTAYRQRAIRLALYLREHGDSKAKDVSAALEEPRAREMLYRNVYGWFDRPSKGIYGLSPRGKEEITQWD
jgi:hypothetical protein